MSSPPPPPAVDARAQLNVPALLLAVIAGLSILFLVFSTVFGEGLQQAMLKFITDPRMREAIEQSQRQQGAATKIFSYGLSFVELVLDGLIIFGALQMRNLKSWGLSMTAAVLAVIPLCPTGCCCIFSMPVAIWALVILNKPEVKAQFT